MFDVEAAFLLPWAVAADRLGLYAFIEMVVFIVILLFGSIASIPQVTMAVEEESIDTSQIELLTKGNPKLDTTLNQLAARTTAGGNPPLLLENNVRLVDNTVRVIIEGVHNKSEEIISAVDALGNIEASYGDLVQVVVPVSQLDAIAVIPDVRFARLPMEPILATTSEGVSVINADDWLAASYNGTGVKIGILDVGFSDYSTRQAEEELPDTIST